MDNVKLLMQILKSGITGEFKINLPELSIDTLNWLYNISNKHDLAHLVGYVLQKNDLLDTKTEIGEKFNKQMMLAVYRTTKLEYDYSQVRQMFEDAQIPYIPLKGSVIRSLYPEKWLRTSCDIDILVQEKNLKTACSILENQGYNKEEKEFNCIPYVTNGGMHLELHYNLNELDSKLDRVLNRVWDYASVNDEHMYSLSNEFFIFHAVAHIVCHFKNGGCGIRTILDLWHILNRYEYDENILNSLLNEAGILTFFQKIVKLTKVWFEGEETDGLTTQLQNYILTGGVYGTTGNKVGVSVARKKTGGKHIFSRLFPPYSVMVSLYSNLKKHPILLPFYWIRRIFKLLNKDKKQRALYEVQVARNVSKEHVEQMQIMLDELGLN